MNEDRFDRDINEEITDEIMDVTRDDITEVTRDEITGETKNEITDEVSDSPHGYGKDPRLALAAENAPVTIGLSRGRAIILAIGMFFLGVALTLGCMIAMGGNFGGSSSSDGIDDSKLNEINTYINKYYLEDYEQSDLVNNAYRGYVAGLGDPYSAYMTAEEYDSYETSTMGSYSGVGVTFETDANGNYLIVSVNKNSPAEKAGLKSGDYILKVDGESYSSSDVMASHIRGKKGTEVELTILRGEDEKTFTMTRAKIVQESVDYKMLDDNTGYIQITQFIDATADDFNKALADIESRGARKLILDLRDNGGGLVDDAISIADDFLDAGVACYVQDKEGNREEYKVKDGKTDLETVVLVNGNSASASEILAGAMQDNGYTIIGQKTFGKGIIQTSFTMKDGDALKLTVLEYLTPDEHKVHKEGITPDVKVKDKKSTDADEQLEKAEDVLNK